MPDKSDLPDAASACAALGTNSCPSGLLMPQNVPAVAKDLSGTKNPYRLDSYKVSGEWVSKTDGKPSQFPGMKRKHSKFCRNSK